MFVVDLVAAKHIPFGFVVDQNQVAFVVAVLLEFVAASVMVVAVVVVEQILELEAVAAVYIASVFAALVLFAVASVMLVVE